MDSQHYNPRKLILISNDDGYQAPGINRLVEWLRPLADIVVMAPDGGRSGAACSITSLVPIMASRVRSEEGLDVYACTGAPVDCVKLAVNEFLDRKPDLVVSGINHGNNASINVHYSGTLGAVIEAALRGLKAVAFSVCNHEEQADLSALRPYVVKITEQALAHDMPPYTCLNVNFPNATQFRGVKVGKMGRTRWENEFEKCSVPSHGTCYFLTGNWTDTEPWRTDTDSAALAQGYVAVTPVTVDVTSHELLSEVEHWDMQP